MSTDRNTAQVKDPDARLDYPFDWSEWLADGETISSYTVVVVEGGPVEASEGVEAKPGVELDGDSNTGTAIVAWITSGRAGVQGKIRCRITTSAGRTDDRTLTLNIKER